MRKSQIRKNPKLRKALVDSIENGAIDKLKEVDGGSNLLLKHINKLLAEWKAEFIKDYEKIMPEMEAYFNEKKKQNGSAYFIPKSPNEMFEKFIHEIRNRDSLHLSLEWKDFISFSNVVKQELDNSLSNNDSNEKDGRKEETDKRKGPGYDKMKQEAREFLNTNRERWIKDYKPEKSPFINNEILPHLKLRFPDAKKYPSESHLRLNVLNWDGPK